MSKTAESIIENAYNIAKEEFPDLPWQPFNITDRGNQIFLEAMNAYADQRVSEALNSQWVKCSERMPEPEVEVLISYKFPSGREVQAISFVTKEHPNIFDHVFFELITHWQPLPSPPLNH